MYCLPRYSSMFGYNFAENGRSLNFAWLPKRVWVHKMIIKMRPASSPGRQAGKPGEKCWGKTGGRNRKTEKKKIQHRSSRGSKNSRRASWIMPKRHLTPDAKSPAKSGIPAILGNCRQNSFGARYKCRGHASQLPVSSYQLPGNSFTFLPPSGFSPFDFPFACLSSSGRAYTAYAWYGGASNGSLLIKWKGCASTISFIDSISVKTL